MFIINERRAICIAAHVFTLSLRELNSIRASGARKSAVKSELSRVEMSITCKGFIYFFDSVCVKCDFTHFAKFLKSLLCPLYRKLYYLKITFLGSLRE